MRYISLLLVLQKFYIRALQTAVKREREPHETNILGFELGRSTAGITATLRQVLSKAAEWVWRLLWPQLMWKVLLIVSNMWMSSVPCCKEEFILDLFVLCSGKLVISKVELTCPELQCRFPFPYARGARQGSVEGPVLRNQVLDNALRELAARWESEKIGFKLATDYRRLRKESRSSLTGEDMDGTEDAVLFKCAGQMTCMQRRVPLST